MIETPPKGLLFVTSRQSFLSLSFEVLLHILMSAIDILSVV